MDVEGWVHGVEVIVAGAAVVATFLFGWWVKIQGQRLAQSKEAFQVEQERIEAERKRKREDTEEARRQAKEDTAEEDQRIAAVIAEYQQLQNLMRKDKEADRKIVHDVRDQCNTLAVKVAVLEQQNATIEAQHKECQRENAELRKQVVTFQEALRRAKLWPWPTDRDDGHHEESPQETGGVQ